MKKVFFSILLFSLFIQGYHAQETGKDYSEATKIIESWLEAQKDHEQLPGIMAISKKGR